MCLRREAGAHKLIMMSCAIAMAQQCQLIGTTVTSNSHDSAFSRERF